MQPNVVSSKVDWISVQCPACSRRGQFKIAVFEFENFVFIVALSAPSNLFAIGKDTRDAANELAHRIAPKAFSICHCDLAREWRANNQQRKKNEGSWVSPSDFLADRMLEDVKFHLSTLYGEDED